jgi:DNA-binding CsgD family transcriptional regulator
LTADPERRARRLLAAGEAFWIGGETEAAVAAGDAALRQTSDTLVRADVQLLLGRLEIRVGNVMDAHAALVAEAARVGDLDTARAAVLLAEAAFAAGTGSHCFAALDAARRAATLAEPMGGEIQLVTHLLLGAALTMRGYSKEADSLFDALTSQIDSADSPSSLSLWASIGHPLVWREDFERARTWADRLVAAGENGIVGPVPVALTVALLLEYRLGAWASANAIAMHAMALARELGQPTVLAFLWTELARLEAVRGDEAACRGHVAEAMESVTTTGALSIELQARSALGLLELGLGRADDSVVALEPMLRLIKETGLAEPSTVQWTPDLIETYVLVGRRDNANEVLESFEAQAEQTGRNWAHAAAGRCRGILAADDCFDREFETAISWHDRTPMPFERARTLLCYGERLRRARRPTAARRELQRALEVFERLGAHPWSARARRELRAAGGTAPRAGTKPADLTAQELQVALLVARGASNREAASALFLSPKTIEFHLRNAYGKLGVRNRTELANRMTQTVG